MSCEHGQIVIMSIKDINDKAILKQHSLYLTLVTRIEDKCIIMRLIDYFHLTSIILLLIISVLEYGTIKHQSIFFIYLSSHNRHCG